jgi:hypothetical protein
MSAEASLFPTSSIAQLPMLQKVAKIHRSHDDRGGESQVPGFPFLAFPSFPAFGNLLLAIHPQRPWIGFPTSALPSTQVHATAKSSTLITRIFGDPDLDFALSGNSRHRSPERKSAVIASNRLRKRAIWFT